MPTLKQLTCNVEWAGSRVPLGEYHTIYADGYVETFIAVPSTPTPFSIHLRSHGYIAPGLAMFVYIDGVYQCNRNRRNLEIPDGTISRKKTEVDFVVRQKEELLWDGTFEGKQWRFEKVRIVPDSNVEDSNRPPHGGEYVGTVEIVVLRCLHSNKRPIIGNEPSSDESFNGNERTSPGCFDGASDPHPESKSRSKSEYQTQPFSLDGGWDDWGPPPPPLEEPKMGRIEMKSEDMGTWNPVGQASRSSNIQEKTRRWAKRSESRDHFRSDFQKHGSPAGSQRGHSGQPRSTADQENAPQLNLRGGGPGSYSIASSEAMRNWNRGPPVLKEWAPGQMLPIGQKEIPAALDPWTANLPTGEFKSEAETEPHIQVGTWETMSKTRNRPGNKKGKNDHFVSKDPNHVPGAWGESNDQDQGRKDGTGENDDQNPISNGDKRSTSGDSESDSNAHRGDLNYSAQSHDQWNAGGGYTQERNDDWNNKSNWDAPNNNGKKDDNIWDVPNDISSGNQDDWGGNDKNDTKQNGEREATQDNDLEQDIWGATTGNDAQQGDGWGRETEPQAETWGGDDTKQVTTGAKDPEKANKPTGNQSAASAAGSAFSFGNSRAKGPKLVSNVGSQGKPASMKSKAASVKPNKKLMTFDWLQPSPDKASKVPGPPVTVGKASIPGASASPIASPRKGGSRTVAAPMPQTFSISTLLKPKPYWSTWRNPNMVAEAEIEQEKAPSLEEFEEPVYSIPAEVAKRNMMSHQLRPGRPAAYTHKRNKPEYMDTHENPYAVFLFKYRDKEIIEHMLQTTISEPEVDEKARLASLSKQELIDELIKTKSKLSVTAESDSSGQATFVKKLDEKLSQLETGKEDAPVVSDWVNTTIPADGEGIGNAGASGTKDTQKGNGGGNSGNGNGTSSTNGRDKGIHASSNDNANGNGGEWWGVNGDSNNNDNNNNNWNNNGNEVSNEAKASGSGGNDWGNANENNGDDPVDGNGWNWTENGGGGDWHNNDSGDTKSTGNRGHDKDDDPKAAGDWGKDNVGGKDKGGDGWENGGGEVDAGWGGDDGKQDQDSWNNNAGFASSWGANTGGGGGGW